MKSTHREANFIKSTFVLAFGTFLPKFASFVTLPIYTSRLTKEEYGTFDLITILCTLLLPVATLQIQSAAFRFLLDCKENPKKQKMLITLLFMFIVPISALVLLIFYFCMYMLPPNLRIMIILYYFADILLIVTRQIARGLSKNHCYSISTIINSFLNMALVVVFLVFMNLGLDGLMLSLTISAVVSLVYIVFALKLWQYICIDSLDKSLLKSMISYSWPMIPNSISLWIIRVSDRAIITMFMGAAANAVYTAANKIPTLLQLLQNTFQMSWQESASISVKDEDATQYYSDMFRNLHRIMAGFTALLMSFQPIIFTILIRGDYSDSYVHIAILDLAMFFSNVAIYLGGIYLANMKTKSVGVTTVISAVINIVINVVFIRKIGIFAATLSTAISYLFLMVYRLIDVQKMQKIKYPISEMIVSNIILVGMCFICYFRSMPFYLINAVVGISFCFILNRKLLKKLSMSVIRKLKKKI